LERKSIKLHTGIEKVNMANKKLSQIIMYFIDGPKNYEESLAILSITTFITTLLFFLILSFSELIPQVEIPERLIPPIDERKELIQWLLSFGAIPLIAAVLALVASYTFELHNKISWWIGVRPFWSKSFILIPLKKRARSSVALTSKNAKLIMDRLYYPGIKNIDQLHVHLFWRHASQFWMLFEHLIIVFFTALFLSAFLWKSSVAFLWLYFILLFVLTAWHLFSISGPRSRKQAMEIPSESVDEFFRTHFPDDQMDE
jgi:hypothetical protein